MAKKKDGQAARTPRTDKATAEKRTYFKQGDFPVDNAAAVQKIASAIIDNFAGTEGSPPDIALAIGISPTSSAWPALAGASIAYGLTDGSVNANIIKLQPSGRSERFAVAISPDERVNCLVRRKRRCDRLGAATRGR